MGCFTSRMNHKLHLSDQLCFSVLVTVLCLHPSSVQPLFAYVTQEKYTEDGWNIYKPVEEFRRQVRRKTIAASKLYCSKTFYPNHPFSLSFSNHNTCCPQLES